MESPTAPDSSNPVLPKRPTPNLWLKGLLVVGVPLVLVGVMISFNQGRATLQEGQPVPNFTLPDLAGENQTLSDYKGKVVMVHFWATWCPSCIKEFPALQQMYKLHASENFEILAISIESNGRKRVPRFVAQWPLGFKILLDEKNSLASIYGTTGVPETFLIDKNGILVKKYIGPQDWDQAWFQKELKPLLQ